MNDKDILTKLAIMDGMIDVRLQLPYYPDDSSFYDFIDSPNGHPTGIWKGCSRRCEVKNYLNSHEDIMLLIKKQGDDILIPLMKWLYAENDDIGIMKNVFLATPRQLCIALLKAKGKWEMNPDCDAPNYEADSTWQEKFKKTFEKPVTRKPRK